MKKTKITKLDYIKANKIGSREASLENATGFVAIDKAHTSKKAYKRKSKHKNKELVY